LKLQTTDIEDNYQLRDGRMIGVLDIVRRPNDHMDERIDEPAVKTLPGLLHIGHSLTQALMKYIVGDRRVAMNSRKDDIEHSYLFVCHSGKNVGKPISRRNLIRIVAKLKTVASGFEEISSHVLRHTHFTEIADHAEMKGTGKDDIKAMLINRGRWAPHSTMPELYTQRRIERKTAELIAEREKLIAPKKKKSVSRSR